MKPNVTVLIPCAGISSRFGGMYPKELHALDHNVTVIDESLKPILELKSGDNLNVRVVLVCDSGRNATMQHVNRMFSWCEVVFVFQEDKTKGFQGAIELGLNLCEGLTILVLPDQFYAYEEGKIFDFLDLTRDFGKAALTYNTTDKDLLCREGAVQIDFKSKHIVAAEEKPKNNLHRYNGVWVSIAVLEENKYELLTLNNELFNVLSGVPTISVEGYYNVRTPLDVMRYLDCKKKYG